MSFQFKQFIIQQDHCAQKVSELACIQGAWTRISSNAIHVLDIGSGTGLLSLMLAQKFDVTIDAIEIDDDTYTQGKENIKASSFANKINCLHGDIRTYHFHKHYDFIITNPPFFEKQLLAASSKANTAKHSTQLSLNELISSSVRCLHPKGKISMLFPFDRKHDLETCCSSYHLYPEQYLIVRHTVSHLPKVFIAILSFEKKVASSEDFIIKERGIYTNAMKELMQDFYL